MIMITSSYDMNWPPEVTDFLQQIAPLMEFQRMLVAFDCFMDPRNIEDIGEFEFEAREDEFRITYWKLIIYAVMPIVLGMISIST
jgi:hypothetical protein